MGSTLKRAIRLITAPRFLWFEFNPVSFWIATQNGSPVAMVAEVNSTFGQRHCYYCAKPDQVSSPQLIV